MDELDFYREVGHKIYSLSREIAKTATGVTGVEDGLVRHTIQTLQEAGKHFLDFRAHLIARSKTPTRTTGKPTNVGDPIQNAKTAKGGK